MPHPEHKPLGLFWRGVVLLGRVMTATAALALAATILVICVDVALRTAGHPVKGAYDLVRIFGAITIACALPLTTAVKGHVAIEYFFQKLNRTGRLVVDSLMRLVMIGAFALAALGVRRYGSRSCATDRFSDTIELRSSGSPGSWRRRLPDAVIVASTCSTPDGR